ncbi:hypothetical protein Lal_00029750, partial [Lupinus albus]
DWFVDNIWKENGNDFQTLFWDDVWVGIQSLKMVFPRLFHLATNQLSWLIRRRLPTKDKLFKRNVIVRVDEMMCIFCNNHVETIDHLFSSCDFVASIWKEFYSWLQISVINLCSVLNSLNCAKLWRMHWFTVVWSVWIMRNEVIFLEKEPSYVHLIDIIQIRSWT